MYKSEHKDNRNFEIKEGVFNKIKKLYESISKDSPWDDMR